LRAGVALQEALKRNEEQLAQQTALLQAAHVLSSELDLPVVLQRLADQLAQLLDADAADCYLLDNERGLFRCVAVHGFDRSLLGFEFPLGQGLAAAAVHEGRPLIESAYGEIAAPVPHPAYDGFTDVITAPMFWSDEVHGVLGVGRREGRRFAERDANILEAFAGLASLAPAGTPRCSRRALGRRDPARLTGSHRARQFPSRARRSRRSPGRVQSARAELGRGARALERPARGGRAAELRQTSRISRRACTRGDQSLAISRRRSGRILVSSSIWTTSGCCLTAERPPRQPACRPPPCR
jgi:hypothetical protein